MACFVGQFFFWNIQKPPPSAGRLCFVDDGGDNVVDRGCDVDDDQRLLFVCRFFKRVKLRVEQTRVKKMSLSRFKPFPNRVTVTTQVDENAASCRAHHIPVPSLQGRAGHHLDRCGRRRPIRMGRTSLLTTGQMVTDGTQPWFSVVVRQRLPTSHLFLVCQRVKLICVMEPYGRLGARSSLVLAFLWRCCACFCAFCLGLSLEALGQCFSYCRLPRATHTHDQPRPWFQKRCVLPRLFMVRHSAVDWTSRTTAEPRQPSRCLINEQRPESSPAILFSDLGSIVRVLVLWTRQQRREEVCRVLAHCP
eukprot:m.15999 g.15999  ORF g.15999 m.15999 type:complete len:306 (-) comp5135_c0_seq1:2410-3327(-)